MLDDKDSAYCKVAKLLYPVLSNANLGVFFLAFVLFCFVCLSVCFLFFLFFFSEVMVAFAFKGRTTYKHLLNSNCSLV